MLLGARQFFEKRGAPTPPLPYDAEVEYLESTGTQWINTGHETNGVGITIDVVASKTTSATNEMAIAGRVASVGFELYFINGQAIIWTQSFTIASSVGISANNAYHIIAATDSNSLSISVDGVVDSRTGSVTGSHVLSPIMIFNYNNRFPFIGRIYSCKIYAGSTLVRDFIPVRKYGVGYMYDLANPTGGAAGDGFYANAGTGAFTIGPDKS